MEELKPIDISIIIVNYNVKEFLANLLNSIYKAQHQLSLEIIVVDNASIDDSINYLKKRYPKVIYLANEQNVGFGKANNQAINISRGKYALIINPDTLIREDTLITMYNHMENHPETGAAGCKLLNPDGSFALESRRSIPTPFSALWKILGLTALFPKNKTFADYYLSWMDEDKPSRVPVLSGSFMFFRTEVLKELKGFDDQFFMYGEDIDLCHRVNEAGYNIDYVPDTSIVHFKGESTKKDNIDYIVLFNKALYQFFKKHYGYSYSIFFRTIVLLGILIRGVISYGKALFKKGLFPLSELLIINLIVSAGFILRFNINLTNGLQNYQLHYLTINILITTIFLLGAKYYNLYSKNRNSILTIVKTVILSFAGVALITFFVRQFAFSRLILGVGLVISTIILSLGRLIRKNLLSNPNYVRGRIRPVKLFIVGTDETTSRFIRRIRTKVDWNYEISGLISDKPVIEPEEVENVPIIGSINELPGLVHKNDIDQIIFMLGALSHDEILHVITQIQDVNVVYKMVPDSLDFIIGKSNIEYLDDIPVLDVELAYKTPWNQFVKRSFDIIVSLILIILMMPFVLPALIIQWNKKDVISISGKFPNSTVSLFSPYLKHKWKNRYLLYWQILKGKISFVGAPLTSIRNEDLTYKRGMTGLRQINESRVYHESEKERYEIYYLQNYSIWLDIDILLKTLAGKSKPLISLDAFDL
ncbi:MAG TPA: glycosyltransferase [Balneolales bacterium]|nr:glycosyltransferase [Balneolales bacterium]